jgi:hypothetical protein
MSEFIVDACVLRSAGVGTTKDSIGSRAFIDAVFSGKHQVLLSSALDAEWSLHASKLAINWIASMESHGLVIRAEANSAMSVEIDRNVDKLDASYVGCARKDAHLVKMALCFHALVVSWERRSRGVFCRLSLRFDPLHEVRWVAPTTFLAHGFLSRGSGSYPAQWTLSFSC